MFRDLEMELVERRGQGSRADVAERQGSRSLRGADFVVRH